MGRFSIMFQPFSGMLFFASPPQILQRLRYILEVSRPPGAVLPVLAVLTAFGRSGEAAARAIAKSVSRLHCI